MKNYIKLASLILLIFATTSFATEAWSPIAYGIKAKGMGGVSIGMVHGAESGLANPALLSFTKKNQVSAGLTYLKTNSTLSDSTQSMSSYDDYTYSPYLVTNYKATDNIHVGIGISNFSIKVGYNDPDLGFVQTIYEQTKYSLPVSYKINDFSFGASLILEKAVLKDKQNNASIKASSADYGYDLGIAYNPSDAGVIIAFNYKSKIEHSLSSDAYLNSPQEYGVGISWKIPNTPHTIAIDYKKVDSSNLLKDNINTQYTKDQNVFGIGYMYGHDKWNVKVGYKYVSDLYKDKLSDTAVLFPYSANSHYTVGGSYAFTDNFSIDAAFVYAQYDHSDGTFNIKMRPISISLGLNYNF